MSKLKFTRLLSLRTTFDWWKWYTSCGQINYLKTTRRHCHNASMQMCRRNSLIVRYFGMNRKYDSCMVYGCTLCTHSYSRGLTWKRYTDLKNEQVNSGKNIQFEATEKLTVQRTHIYSHNSHYIMNDECGARFASYFSRAYTWGLVWADRPYALQNASWKCAFNFTYVSFGFVEWIWLLFPSGR